MRNSIILDLTNGTGPVRFQGPSVARLPLDEENNEDAVRQAIWDEVNNRYKFAVDMYQKTKAESSVNVEEEDKAPYFRRQKVEKYYEAPLPAEKMTIDMDQWAARMKEISAVFKNQPGIMKGGCDHDLHGGKTLFREQRGNGSRAESTVYPYYGVWGDKSR